MSSNPLILPGRRLTAGRHAAAERPWVPALRYCLGVYAVVRVALFVLAATTWGLGAVPASGMPDGRVLTLHNGWQNAIAVWPRWDSNWYLYIAETGYSDHNNTAAFYPGYPMLIRLVSYLFFGHVLPAAFIVSNGALLAALYILYRLTEREYDTAFARRAVLYLALFPTAVFLFSIYSESLFLLAAVGAFYLARINRWGWAGLTGIIATLTRSMGAIVVLALAVEAIHQAIEERRGQATGLPARTALRLGASALPLAGIIGYLLFWELRYHDWSRPLRLEKAYWGRQFGLPWVTLWHGLTDAWTHGQIGNNALWTFDFVLVALGLLLGIWVAIRTRPIYAVYTWGSILIFLSESIPWRPLTSDPRYLVTIFPLAWTLAWLGRRQHVHEAVVGLSAASMGIVAWLFLTNAGVY
ncbi:MAG: hypothetical protein J2P29_01950 [Actinobacteria bacterium]|nr:hypothetical protein [Actinomycetota bacterium]